MVEQMTSNVDIILTPPTGKGCGRHAVLNIIQHLIVRHKCNYRTERSSREDQFHICNGCLASGCGWEPLLLGISAKYLTRDGRFPASGGTTSRRRRYSPSDGGRGIVDSLTARKSVLSEDNP